MDPRAASLRPRRDPRAARGASRGPGDQRQARRCQLVPASPGRVAHGGRAPNALAGGDLNDRARRAARPGAHRARAHRAHGDQGRLLHWRLAVVRRPDRAPLHPRAAADSRDARRPGARLPAAVEGARRAGALRHPGRARLHRPRPPRQPPVDRRLHLLASQPPGAGGRVPLRLARSPAVGRARHRA